MSGDCVVRIEKLENGYTVGVRDPKVDAANSKPKSTWEDPWKEYGFTTADEVKTFIGEHLDKLKPPPDADAEFASGFAQATKD